MKSRSLLITIAVVTASLFLSVGLYAASAPDVIPMNNAGYKKHKKAIVQFNLALGVRPNAPEALEGLQRAALIEPTPALLEGTPTSAGPAATTTPATSDLVRPATWPTDWPWPPQSTGQ